MASRTKGTGVFIPPAVQAGFVAATPATAAPGSGLLFSSKAQTVASLKPRNPSLQPPTAQQGPDHQPKGAPDARGSGQPPTDAAGDGLAQRSELSMTAASTMMPTSPCNTGSRWASSDGSSAEFLPPQGPLQEAAPRLMTKSVERSFMPNSRTGGPLPCLWKTANPVSNQGMAQAPATVVAASGLSSGFSPHATGQLPELNSGDKQHLLELQMRSRFVPVLGQPPSSRWTAAAVSPDGLEASGLSVWTDDTSCLPATMWFDSAMSSGQICHGNHLLKHQVPTATSSSSSLMGLMTFAKTGAAAAEDPPLVRGHLSGSCAQPVSGNHLLPGPRLLDTVVSAAPSGGSTLPQLAASLFAADNLAATGWVSLPLQASFSSTSQQQLLSETTSEEAAALLSGQHMLLLDSANGNTLSLPSSLQLPPCLGKFSASATSFAVPGMIMDPGCPPGREHLLVSTTAAAPQHMLQYGSPAEWAAAASNKLEQLRQVEEMKAALKLEILQLLVD